MRRCKYQKHIIHDMFVEGHLPAVVKRITLVSDGGKYRKISEYKPACSCGWNKHYKRLTAQWLSTMAACKEKISEHIAIVQKISQGKLPLEKGITQ